ncbi:MAG TPA: hypothetical protein VNP92_16410, partial [Actinophytocola sp.]|nr:hypothetical protein [Actinophytocola sp.]
MAEVAGLPPSTLHHAIRNRRRPWDYWELKSLVEKLGEEWDTGWELLWRNAVDPFPDRMPPAGLPLDTIHFTGRDNELSRLSE